MKNATLLTPSSVYISRTTFSDILQVESFCCVRFDSIQVMTCTYEDTDHPALSSRLTNTLLYVRMKYTHSREKTVKCLVSLCKRIYFKEPPPNTPPKKKNKKKKKKTKKKNKKNRKQNAAGGNKLFQFGLELILEGLSFIVQLTESNKSSPLYRRWHFV